MALFGNDTTLTQITEQRDQALTELRAEQEMNLLLEESVADLELSLEDRGWARLTTGVRDEFTPHGRRVMADVCRSMAIANPLIKRGLQVRIGYIWGQGVEIRGKAAEDAGQDVNAVVQAFLDDNRRSLTGSQPQEELERALGTDGNVILACFTSPLTGRVQVRSTPFEEITEIICNPEDRDDPWFYVREWVEEVVEAGYGGTRTRRQRRKAYHPDLAYRPTVRPRSINGCEVRWDAPMLHVPVNRFDGWKFGVPDVYCSVAFARMYKDFLVDWALVVKSLSKFTWRQAGGDKGRAARAAAKLKANAAATNAAARPVAPAAAAAGVGQAVVASDNQTFEAISKSGATIDADSGRPLAAMTAAGLGVSVVTLLADPGVTGARAVAETLDLPTVLEMGMRRLLWQAKLTELIEYVIDQAVIAPRGLLRGALKRDEWDRMQVTLAGEVEKTLEFDWPALIDVDPVELVKAIVAAEGSVVGQSVPLVMLRLLLGALGVKDVDEVLAEVTDDQGRFIHPTMSAGQVAVDAFNRGDDPAAAVR